MPLSNETTIYTQQSDTRHNKVDNLLNQVKTLQDNLLRTPHAYGFVKDGPVITDNGRSTTARELVKTETDAAFECIISILERLQKREIYPAYAHFALRMFLTVRGPIIQHSSLDYTAQPYFQLTRACLAVAEVVGIDDANIIGKAPSPRTNSVDSNQQLARPEADNKELIAKVDTLRQFYHSIANAKTVQDSSTSDEYTYTQAIESLIPFSEALYEQEKAQLLGTIDTFNKTIEYLSEEDHWPLYYLLVGGYLNELIPCHSKLIGILKLLDQQYHRPLCQALGNRQLKKLISSSNTDYASYANLKTTLSVLSKNARLNLLQQLGSEWLRNAANGSYWLAEFLELIPENDRLPALQLLGDELLKAQFNNINSLEEILNILPENHRWTLCHTLGGMHLTGIAASFKDIQALLSSLPENARWALCEVLGGKHLNEFLLEPAQLAAVVSLMPKAVNIAETFVPHFAIHRTLDDLVEKLLHQQDCKLHQQLTSDLAGAEDLKHHIWNFQQLVVLLTYLENEVDFKSHLHEINSGSLQAIINTNSRLIDVSKNISTENYKLLCEKLGERHTIGLLSNGNFNVETLQQLPKPFQEPYMMATVRKSFEFSQDKFHLFASILKTLPNENIQTLMNVIGEDSVKRLIFEEAVFFHHNRKRISEDYKQDYPNDLRTMIKVLPLTAFEHADDKGRRPLGYLIEAGAVDSTWAMLLKGVNVNVKENVKHGMTGKERAERNSAMKPLRPLFTSAFQQHSLIKQCQQSLATGDYKTAFKLPGIAKKDIKSALLYAAVTGRLLLLLHDFCLAEIARIMPEAENANELETKWRGRAEDIEKKLNFYLDWQKVSEACTKTPAPSQQLADAQQPQAEAGTAVSSQVARLGNR